MLMFIKGKLQTFYCPRTIHHQSLPKNSDESTEGFKGYKRTRIKGYRRFNLTFSIVNSRLPYKHQYDYPLLSTFNITWIQL